MKDKPDDIQIKRLPKWASDWISQCERRCADAESKLKDYLDNQSPSFIYTRSGLTDKHYIQDDRVSFKLKNGEITATLRDDTLEVHASYGCARLIIVPHVTNVLHLEIEDNQS